jgi:TetR/AcrR family transcriptional regulator of autoinduction and epiphytic fitness
MDSRVQRSKLLVRRAALEQLAEHGFAGFTIDAVARRSGVARTTIYRHWSSPVAMAVDALDALNRQPAPAGTAEPPLDRVSSLLLHLVEALNDPLRAGCLRALVDGAGRDPALRALLDEYSTRRGAALVAAVAAGVADGSFAQVDPETAAHALAGAVFYRALLTTQPPTPEVVERLVATVLAPSDR